MVAKDFGRYAYLARTHHLLAYLRGYMRTLIFNSKEDAKPRKKAIVAKDILGFKFEPGLVCVCLCSPH